MCFTENQLSDLLMSFSSVVKEFNVLEEDVVEIVIDGKEHPLIVYVSFTFNKNEIKAELFFDDSSLQDDEVLIKTLILKESEYDLRNLISEFKEFLELVD